MKYSVKRNLRLVKEQKLKNHYHKFFKEWIKQGIITEQAIENSIKKLTDKQLEEKLKETLYVVEIHE